MSSSDTVGQAGPERTRRGAWERLPEWCQPRAREPKRSGWQRPFELVALIAVGLILTIATVNDVFLQVGKDNRLSADVRTWRHATGHDYVNVTTENGEENGWGTRDVTCANTSTNPRPGFETQKCLIMVGPIKNSFRAVRGGYYLPAYYQDSKSHRYGCFGVAIAEKLCESSGLEAKSAGAGG